jgi:hypothetical protein
MAVPSVQVYIEARRAAFAHAMRALGHPYAVLAVALVLFNDHLLRQSWPSWLTGKIGDFAWLIFAPMVLAVFLIWLVPTRIASHSQRLGLLAFSLVGLEFTLAKTVPLVHFLTVRTYEFVIAWPSTLRLDPSDLIALPALYLGWHIWIGAPSRPQTVTPTGGVILSLALLATLADSAAPNYGVRCLIEEDGNLYASVAYGNLYISQDGGANWLEYSGDSNPDVNCQTHAATWQADDAENVATQYRFAPGAAIEKSLDGGQTWHVEVDLTREQARVVFQDMRYNGGYGVLQPGPLDALIHSKTQNVVVAMGHQGILLGTPDGKWQWIAVGPYFRSQPASIGDFVFLLRTELWLGLVLAVLVVGTFFWRTRKRNYKKISTWLVGISWLVAWGAWLFAAIIGEPATNNNYGYAWVTILPPIWLAAIVGVPLAIAVSVEVFHFAPRALGILLTTAVGSALLYLVPLFIWAAGGIPRYASAAIYASALVVAVLLAGDRFLQFVLRGGRPPGESP